jgi:hypothetical protein
MSARSLSSKMAKSASSLGSGEGSSVMDMVLMGAGVAVIILLLVYIYNRFIQKQPAKNEYFGIGYIDRNNNQCICGKEVDPNGEVSCVKCRYGTKTDGTCETQSG